MSKVCQIAASSGYASAEGLPMTRGVGSARPQVVESTHFSSSSGGRKAAGASKRDGLAIHSCDGRH